MDKATVELVYNSNFMDLVAEYVTRRSTFNAFISVADYNSAFLCSDISNCLLLRKAYGVILQSGV